jgi:CBS domain-containing protein
LKPELEEENQIRRVPVVNGGGACTGIVVLADVAKNNAKKDSAEVLQRISAPRISASNVG